MEMEEEGGEECNEYIIFIFPYVKRIFLLLAHAFHDFPLDGVYVFHTLDLALGVVGKSG